LVTLATLIFTLASLASRVYLGDGEGNDIGLVGSDVARFYVLSVADVGVNYLTLFAWFATLM
jgi:hypothetical protein